MLRLLRAQNGQPSSQTNTKGWLKRCSSEFLAIVNKLRYGLWAIGARLEVLSITAYVYSGKLATFFHLYLFSHNLNLRGGFCYSSIMNPHVCVLLNNEYTHDTRVKRCLTTLSAAGYGVSLVATNRRQADKLPEQETMDGATVYRLLPRRLNTYKPLSFRQLTSLITIINTLPTGENAPTVVHANDVNMLLLGFLLANHWGAALIYDAHEHWPSLISHRTKETGNTHWWQRQGRELKILPWLETTLAKRADAVITVGDEIAKRYTEQLGWKKSPPVATVRNIPKTTPTTPDDAAAVAHIQAWIHSEDTPVLVYVGGIGVDRGLNTMLAAVPNIQQPVRLMFMGSFLDANSEAILTQAAEKSPETIKHFLPVQPHQVGLAMAGAAISLAPIVPIKLSYELCLPNKLFESIHAGVPVVASNLPEMAALINHYHVGQTHAPEDATDLARAITTVLTNGKQAYSEGLKTAARELTWAHESDTLLKLYQQVTPCL